MKGKLDLSKLDSILSEENRDKPKDDLSDLKELSLNLLKKKKEKQNTQSNGEDKNE